MGCFDFNYLKMFYAGKFCGTIVCRYGGDDVTYDFDQLNWMAGYLSGQFKINDLEGFYEIVALFRQFYQLENLDLDDCLDLLKKRFAKARWVVLMVPDFGEDGVSTTFHSNVLFTKIFQDYDHLMPLFCPMEKHNKVLQTNRLYAPFEHLIYHLKELPFLFVFDQKTHYYLHVDSRQELLNVLEQLNQGKHPKEFVKTRNDQLAYFIQLSDFHFGSLKKRAYSEVLLKMLDEQMEKIPDNCPVKFLITGDLMDSPKRRNMYVASGFLNELKRRYHADVQFVLGNHDMVVNGFNVFRRQKAKVVAYLLGENIHVLEDVKVILIKLNSSLHGNFARGMVGERQLQEIDDELTTVQNLESYTPFVMVHHHLLPVQKADFLKTSWKEKFIVAKVMEKSKTLVDSEQVLSWMRERQIRYAFHGHQHIPALSEKDHIYIMGSGSSTGIMKDDCDRYLSYNLIQYDIARGKIISCTLFYEDEKRLLPKHIYTRRFEEE